MSETKIKPCPFCGGKAEINIVGFARSYQVSCIDCHVMQTGSEYRKEKQAIEAWNTRKPTERIVEQLNKRIEDAGKIIVEKPADKLDEIANNAAEDFIQAYEECIELIEKDGAERD